MTVALEARGLGKRYGHRWALSGCTLEVPAGHVAGLVGPNGAGKTTLLHLAVGLIEPSEGSIAVLGEGVMGTSAQLARIGFVAQDTPLYPSLSVADHLRLGAALNPGWDPALAEARLTRLGLDRQQRAETLSGGQRAQLALTLAISKRPDLLVLDEPVAGLDPLARREFLQGLMEFTAEHGPSVVLSSHLIADLERVCDYLILVAGGRVQLSGEVDQLLASHRRLSGPRVARLPAGLEVIEESHTDRQSTLLVRTEEPIIDPAWSIDEVGLEDIVLGHMGRTARQCRAAEGRPMIWVAWRQFRTQALVTLGLLAAFAALVIVTGVHLRDTYDAAGGASCGARGDCPIAELRRRWRTILDQRCGRSRRCSGSSGARRWSRASSRAEPSASRGRRASRAVAGCRSGSRSSASPPLAVAGIASWLVSWWSAPIDAVNLNRFDPGMFDLRGVVAIGYAAFALALGVAAGALMRRTLPAMAATLVGFVAARFAFTIWLRPQLPGMHHLLVPVTAGKSLAFFEGPSGVGIAGGAPPLPNAWWLSSALVDRAHHALSAAQLHDLVTRTCPTLAAGFAPGSNAVPKGGPVGGPSNPARKALAPPAAARRLPAGEPLLAAAGTRGRDLPGRRAGADRRDGLADRAPGRAQAGTG